MVDSPRIEDLRRRIQKDPASIAFAQLAEEYRRAGQFQESVDVCRAGLVVHPGYLSAHVTLGRALVELGELEAAQGELELVLKSAPENLAAIRGLAEIHHRRGSLAEALVQYRAALNLARNDPDLEETVNDLTRQLTPQKRAESTDGLSFEQVQQEFAGAYVPPPPAPALSVEPSPVVPADVPSERPVNPPPAIPPDPPPEVALDQFQETALDEARSVPEPRTEIALGEPSETAVESPRQAAVESPPETAVEPSLEAALDQPPVVAAEPPPLEPVQVAPANPEYDRAVRTIAALDEWLTAVHVSRADRRP